MRNYTVIFAALATLATPVILGISLAYSETNFTHKKPTRISGVHLDKCLESLEKAFPSYSVESWKIEKCNAHNVIAQYKNTDWYQIIFDGPVFRINNDNTISVIHK